MSSIEDQLETARRGVHYWIDVHATIALLDINKQAVAARSDIKRSIERHNRSIGQLRRGKK